MDFWRFLDYITEANTNPVVTWYGAISKAAQAEFDALVIAQAKTEDWDEAKKSKRKYKELQKEHKGLTQLIFEVISQLHGKQIRTHFRPIGIMKRSERQFIFLGGCEKHGTLGTIPPDAFNDALRLKTQYEQGRGTTRDH